MKKIIILALINIVLTTISVQGEEVKKNIKYRVKEKIWNNNVNVGSIHHPFFVKLGPSGVYRYKYDESGRLIEVRYGRDKHLLYEFIYLNDYTLKIYDYNISTIKKFHYNSTFALF